MIGQIKQGLFVLNKKYFFGIVFCDYSVNPCKECLEKDADCRSAKSCRANARGLQAAVHQESDVFRLPRDIPNVSEEVLPLNCA